MKFCRLSDKLILNITTMANTELIFTVSKITLFCLLYNFVVPQSLKPQRPIGMHDCKQGAISFEVFIVLLRNQRHYVGDVIRIMILGIYLRIRTRTYHENKYLSL